MYILLTMYILDKAIKQDLCPFFHKECFYVFFIRWWTLPTGTGSCLNPAFPLVRLMIISESTRGHLGASCSNIGRIRTKENIAVDTHLIGIATPLGAIWSYLNLSLTPLGRFSDRIRIRSLRTLLINIITSTILKPSWGDGSWFFRFNIDYHRF